MSRPTDIAIAIYCSSDGDEFPGVTLLFKTLAQAQAAHQWLFELQKEGQSVLEARVRELEFRLKLTEGAFKNTRIRELEDAVREWAAYCRSAKPGPNIADAMLAFIGDPPHDYASDAKTSGDGKS